MGQSVEGSMNNCSGSVCGTPTVSYSGPGDEEIQNSME